MPDEPRLNRLPTWTLWSGRYSTALRALQRAATRFHHLTLTEAPADLNTPHVDYMLRPSLIGTLSHALEDLAEGLYKIEVQARYHHHRPRAQADLNAARKHLSEAATALRSLTSRGRGQ